MKNTTELEKAIDVLKECPQIKNLYAHNKRIIDDSNGSVDIAQGWVDCIEFITNGGLLSIRGKSNGEI